MEIGTILLLASIVLFIIGLINPSFIVPFLKAPSRAKVFGVCTLIGIAGLITNAIIPPVVDENMKKQKGSLTYVNVENAQKSKEIDVEKEIKHLTSISFFNKIKNDIENTKSLKDLQELASVYSTTGKPVTEIIKLLENKCDEEKLNELKKALSNFQKKIYPIIRERFIKVIVLVFSSECYCHSALGTEHSVITFESDIFDNHSEREGFFKAHENYFIKLRFKEVYYNDFLYKINSIEDIDIEGE
jgi:hypothetical protein